MFFIFRINPDYTFLHALSLAQNDEPFSDWSEFTNKIWEKNPATFYFLASAPEYNLYLLSQKSRARLAEQANNVLEAVRSSAQYKRLIKETRDYLAFINQQWQENEKIIFPIIEELSGLKLPKSKITVYLTHPKLKNGLTVDKKTIVWGHPEDFRNYTTIYLCHELMHILTDLDNSQLTHAVIELMTDNELRIRLNQKGTYFEHPGHADLRLLENKLLPDWKNYLKRKDKNIFSFVNKINKGSTLQELTPYSSS